MLSVVSSISKTCPPQVLRAFPFFYRSICNEKEQFAEKYTEFNQGSKVRDNNNSFYNIDIQNDNPTDEFDFDELDAELAKDNCSCFI